jgi:hypothetical protein
LDYFLGTDFWQLATPESVLGVLLPMEIMLNSHRLTFRVLLLKIVRIGERLTGRFDY